MLNTVAPAVHLQIADENPRAQSVIQIFSNEFFKLKNQKSNVWLMFTITYQILRIRNQGIR